MAGRQSEALRQGEGAAEDAAIREGKAGVLEGSPEEIPPLRPPEMRLLRRRLHHQESRQVRLRHGRKQRHVRQPFAHQAGDDLESTVLGALKDRLMDPELCAVFCEEYARRVNELRIERNASIHGYKAELGKLKKQRDRIIQAVKDGYATPDLKVELDNVVARREELESLVARTEEAPVLLRPNMAKHYREQVSGLVQALNSDAHRQEAGDLLRALIDRIALRPNEDGSALLVDLEGDLAGILSLATKKGDAWPKPHYDLGIIEAIASPRNHYKSREAKMVAAEGFEPPTKGL
jgi:site-specific DNA recombinase